MVRNCQAEASCLMLPRFWRGRRLLGTRELVGHRVVFCYRWVMLFALVWVPAHCTVSGTFGILCCANIGCTCTREGTCYRGDSEVCADEQLLPIDSKRFIVRHFMPGWYDSLQSYCGLSGWRRRVSYLCFWWTQNLDSLYQTQHYLLWRRVS